MQIELQRTFGEYTEPQLRDDEVDWREYFGSKRGRLTWKELHQKRVVVVLGEAGIGKTTEFELEAKRLTDAGQSAFFLPLNLLRTTEEWQLALGSALEAFSTWKAGTGEGFFFLDAVDEARLQTHADFTRALQIVRGALAGHMARVRIAISSRVTDWTVPQVAASLATQLLQPLNEAIARANAMPPPEAEPAVPVAQSNSNSERLYVVTLDALSREEAKRCGRHFGLQDDDAFWAAVDEGDYAFMASRPLDLRWMVELWNQRKALGNYKELMEVNVGTRLKEVNPSYQQAGKALSEAQLLAGAQELAAAAEFGGCAFIAVQQSRPTESRIIDAHSVLRDWKPVDVQLLLATAIFDEASFDRVKFHHRSIREYLAARWVDGQLTKGIPLGRLEPLFSGRPFGEVTLIPSRRPVLSWLAAINVRAREWVVSKCPELLLHEGDPQSWDQPSADIAFRALIEASRVSSRVRWFNSASELLRVCRALSSGQIALVLGDPDAPYQAKSLAFRLAFHGKVNDCAAPALAIYQNVTRQEWERVAALDVLQVVGTSAHQAQVLADLEASSISGNQLIAHALPCVAWTELTSSRLSAIFDRTQSESKSGTDPMAWVVKDTLIPIADLASATLLLTAVLQSLPRPTAGRRFSRFSVENQPERAWLLDVLPDCFERLLVLAKEVGAPPIEPSLEAAERIEALRDSGYTDRDEFSRLQAAIKALPSLRWDIALAIAQSEDIHSSINRLVWSNACIVTFGVDDLSDLMSRANDPTLTPDVQDIWFKLGVEVAFGQQSAQLRKSALRSLCGLDNGPRLAPVLERYKQWISGARTRRTWAAEERARKAKRQDELARFKSDLLSRREGIADSSDFGCLMQLVSFAFNNSARNDCGAVDLEVIAAELGAELATAFGEGLRAYWKKEPPPNPSDYPNGAVPWGALAALAGAYLSAEDRNDFTSYSVAEVSAAAQIAVWSLPGPPNWFELLHAARVAEVEAALNPWVLNEAIAVKPGNGVRGALALAMSCPSSIRRGLLAGVTPLALSGAVPCEATLKALISALYEDGLMSSADLDSHCQIELAKLKTASGRILDLFWLRLWIAARPRVAWDWFQQHLSTLSSETDLQVSDFAAIMAGSTWVVQPWDSAAVCLLLEVAAVLRRHGSGTIPEGDIDSAFYGPPTTRMLDSIARGFVGVRGALGRDALQKLIAAETDDERQWNYRRLLSEHAEQEAARGAQWNTERLRSIHTAFDSEPKNEAQLYDQALARLEAVRTSVEEGPFSERALFKPNMLEKHLQLWLAAKFLDTQNRRFSVHREEEVDDDKRTDIQLACAAAKVCVEIKPLDKDRSYSASSLVEDTLKRQIVGQYLKGLNSSSGILVLMQLDAKKWELPDGRGRSFDELVDYLQKEAYQIKLATPTVAELTVFGIRCTN